MSKEIREQPHAVADTLLTARRLTGTLVLDEVRLTPSLRRAASFHRGVRSRLPQRHGGEVRHRRWTG